MMCWSPWTRSGWLSASAPLQQGATTAWQGLPTTSTHSVSLLQRKRNRDNSRSDDDFAKWPRLQKLLALVPQQYTAHAIACFRAASERREEVAPLALSRSGPLQQTAPKYKHMVGCSDSLESGTSPVVGAAMQPHMLLSWAMYLHAVPGARLALSAGKCRG